MIRAEWTVASGLAAVVFATLVASGSAEAKPNPEAKCENGLYTAAQKYDACVQKAFAKFFGGKDFDQGAMSKCRDTYRHAWDKLHAKALKEPTVESCDVDRFTDNGDGTVNDHLTGLQWEQKTDDASVHDKDNLYTWTDPSDLNNTDADGTAFTGFLAALNGGSCLAGQCDWRLPTIVELQTIISQPFPCATSPCIDQTLFGPTKADAYWSSTTDLGATDFAWLVLFGPSQGGQVFFNGKFVQRPVRAVRGGL